MSSAIGPILLSRLKMFEVAIQIPLIHTCGSHMDQHLLTSGNKLLVTAWRPRATDPESRRSGVAFQAFPLIIGLPIGPTTRINVSFQLEPYLFAYRQPAPLQWRRHSHHRINCRALPAEYSSHSCTQTLSPHKFSAVILHCIKGAAAVCPSRFFLFAVDASNRTPQSPSPT